MMYKIAKDRLPELYAAVAAVKDIYVPVENANQCLFEKWTPTSNVNIDCLKTVKSAKEVFFPQSENLISFKVTGKNIDIIEDRDPAAPFVIFGVRACDAKSFEILDNVFLSEPVDSFYKSRRENGVIVTMACNEPEETCFCGAFGINAANPQGGDVTTWLAGDTLYWKAETAKGEELTKSIANLLESAGDSDEKKVEETQASIKAILDKLPLKDLDLSYFSGENLTTKLNDVFYVEQWDELYKACLACGTCTFVCPTCQCSRTLLKRIFSPSYKRSNID
ncbi:MAG: 4Fe-4S ferredoxin [Clostridia bacterium]|nr:4Fe-4S ferredoxin [Clostridia bacterium]